MLGLRRVFVLVMVLAVVHGGRPPAVEDSPEDSSEFSMPSMALSNFQSMIITWAKARDAAKLEPTRAVGLTGLRWAADWSTSALRAQSLAFQIDEQIFADPMGFDADSSLELSGEYVTTIRAPSLPDWATIECTYVLPPSEEFYFVTFRVRNDDSVAHSFRLMNLVETDNPSAGAAGGLGEAALEWGWYDASTNLYMVDLTKTGQFYFAIGAISVNATDFQIGPVDGASSPIEQFATGAGLGMQTVYQGTLVSIGLAHNVTLAAGQETTRVFWHTLQANYDECVGIQSRVMSRSVQRWKADASGRTMDWLSRAQVPPSLSDDQLTFYGKSLLCLKHAQNPTVGTIVASFHPLYGYKGWARDGLFAAMILHSAGYEDEAAAFYRWISSAELRGEEEGGGFHTCYSFWTGEPVAFVEPQFDSAGAYLLAMLHYQKVSGALPHENWIKRTRELEDLFVSQPGKDGFAPADYSIWEESSDPHSGRPLPTSFFAFTQGMAAGGLYAAAQLEKLLNDSQRAAAALRRSEEVREAVENNLYIQESGFYARGMWSDSYELDRRADASSSSLVFTGTANKTRSLSHMDYLRANLTKLKHGIARYDGDPFFYDSLYNPAGREVGAPAPPWGVTTMFVTWCELADRVGGGGLRQSADQVDERIQWMVDVSAANLMPVGEAVDGVSGNFVWASCPDLYEHGGVFIWSALMRDGLTPLPNPHLW